VRIPGRPDQRFESALFHNADDALDWIRLTIGATVAVA
jgi:hypothetical protein